LVVDDHLVQELGVERRGVGEAAPMPPPAIIAVLARPALVEPAGRAPDGSVAWAAA